MRKLSITMGVLLVFVALVSGFLYKYAGLKSHISSIRYFSKLSDFSERSIKENIFFGDKQDIIGINDGGTFAGTVGKNVFLWGKYGLKSYKIDAMTKFITFDNCTNLGSNGVAPIKRSYENLSAWEEAVDPGNQVFIVYVSEGSRVKGKLKIAKKIITNLDYDVTFSEFCHDAYKKQI